jgi:hypothetical protein
VGAEASGSGAGGGGASTSSDAGVAGNGSDAGEMAGSGSSAFDWALWPMPNDPPDVTAGAPNPASYSVNADGTVTDKVTGLMWQQAVSAASLFKLADASAYCASLALSGHHDWRLPSEIELVSLLDFGVGVGSTNLAIDPTVFPNPPTGTFWSTTPEAGASTSVWVLDFGATVRASFGEKTNARNARCVRIEVPATAAGAHYTASNDTVVDNGTKLTWQRSPSATRLTWMDAQTYCGGLGAGWRLPTEKELLTLIDYSQTAAPHIDPSAFPSTPSDSYWSMTPSPNSSPSAKEIWFVSFVTGFTSTIISDSKMEARCVR